MAKGSEDSEPMMEMNTTPLIDVMLVLLIMFIISLPPATHSVKVDLGQNPDPVVLKPDPIRNRVAITADGIVSWNGRPVDMLVLRQYLSETRRMVPEPELQFQPDAAARYARVDETMATIKRSGVTKLGFVGNEQYTDVF